LDLQLVNNELIGNPIDIPLIINYNYTYYIGYKLIYF